MSGARHAEAPNQTANVDLCFVPATHAVAEAVPAVSGSSGRLVVSAPKVEGERDWPGRVFERSDLDYPKAMDQFVAARAAAAAAKPAIEAAEPAAEAVKPAIEAVKPTADESTEQAEAEVKAVRRALKGEAQQLGIARGQERERRRLVDAAWKARQQEHRERLGALRESTAGSRQARAQQRAAVEAQKQAEWVERHRELERRRQENARWREERARLRQRELEVGVAHVMVWIAVLVIVDNCTRRCVGLPLFTLGAHVTADLVVEALKLLLPKELQYLIADGGTHFTGTALKKLATANGFVRVPLAKHRPQSNGIAERFIETLKDWLADKAWRTAEELAQLLREFRAYYNDRPHQGLELAGLSPNEYAARMAVA